MVGADPLATPWPAALAVLAATPSCGLAGLLGRRIRALGNPPLVAAAGQATGATALLLPLALLLQPTPGLPSAGAAAGLALLSTAGAYLLCFRTLEMAGSWSWRDTGARGAGEPPAGHAADPAGGHCDGMAGAG